MSFAHNHIVPEVPEPVAAVAPLALIGPVFASRRTAAAPRRTRVLLIAESASLRDAVAGDMSRDAQVSGQVLQGTLAEMVAKRAVDFGEVDFLVFETGADVWADAKAVERLRSTAGVALRYVAMASAPLEPAARNMLVQAGVQEVLPIPAPGPATAPPLPPSAPTMDAVTPDAMVTAPQPMSAEQDRWSRPEVTLATPPLSPTTEGGGGAPMLAGAAAAPAPISASDTAPGVLTAAPVALARTAPGTAPEGAADPVPLAAAPPVPPRPEASPNGDAATGSLTVILRARGGAGATTLAVNLALGLVGTDAGRTALVDLDIQNGSVGLALDLPDSAPHAAWLRGETEADADFLDRAMVSHASGLQVLTAPDIFAPLEAISSDRIGALLDAALARYRHVVLDMPQAVTGWTASVLARATRVLVVSDLTLPSIKRAKRLVDLIGEEHMTLPVQIVLNQEKKPFLPSALQREAARLIGQPLQHWIPSDPKAARRAIDMGVPMGLGARRSPASRAIAALGASVFDKTRKAS